MTLTDIRSQLDAFNTERAPEPETAALMARATALEAQVKTAEKQLETAREAAADAVAAAESIYARGGKVDAAGRQRARAAAEAAEENLGVMRRALEQIRRDIAQRVATRSERDAAILLPIFHELIAAADERAEAMATVDDLQELAHRVALNVLPGGHILAQGYGGLLPRGGLTAWRNRAVAAGLLKRGA